MIRALVGCGPVREIIGDGGRVEVFDCEAVDC